MTLATADAARPLGSALRPWITALLGGAIVGLFLISDMLLAAHGVNYADVGGSPLEKMHPATWLCVAGIGLMACTLGNPLRIVIKIADRPRLAFFAVAWLMLMVYAVAVDKTPFTPLIDTFLLPMMLFVLLADQSESAMHRFAMMLHAIMIVNAGLGLYEFLTGFRLTPFTAAGLVIDDWRSTALLGHPLANAAATGTYLLALSLGGGRDLPQAARLPVIVLQLAAMVAFGGRTSLVLALVLMACVAGRRVVEILRGAPINRMALVLTMFAAPLVFGALLLIAQAGFFDQLLTRFVDDNGSAVARVIMLKLFDIIPMRDLLVGPDQAQIANVLQMEGIETGIESFWIAFIMIHGIPMSLILFAGFLAFLVELCVVTRPATWVLVAFLLIAASSAIALASKTSMLALFVVEVMVFMRPPAERAV